jgi:hypothetical protein
VTEVSGKERYILWKGRTGRLVCGSKEEEDEDKYVALNAQVEDREIVRTILSQHLGLELAMKMSKKIEDIERE